MLYEEITFSAAELNLSSGMAKDITDISFSSNNIPSKHYRVDTISAENDSGAELSFLPLTDEEYEQYLLDSSITDLIPVSDSGEKELTNLNDATKILVSGSAGHTSEAKFKVYKK